MGINFNSAYIYMLPYVSITTNSMEVGEERNSECELVDLGAETPRKMNENIVISDSQIYPTEHDHLHCRSIRKVYLITYSQANLTRFPTRRAFANAVLASFSYASANVLHWCCSQENHREAGKHYHMALKFDRNQRWLSSKRYLENNDGISVHFSAAHHNYYSAWRYVTKEDQDVIESQPHPYLWNSNYPKTTAASISKKQRATKANREDGAHAENVTQDHDSTNETASEDELVTAPLVNNIRDGKVMKGKKRKRISAFELSEIVVRKGIKSRTELLVLAKEQKDEGKTDIAEFIVNRGAKVVAEVLETAWEMENAKEKLSRARKSRMELLMEAKQGDCVEGCNGDWLECAKEVLHSNGVILSSFQKSVMELLTKGRGKYRNIMIVGPANCGKTFILNPLTKLFVTFSNPASTTFAWVDAEKAECLFLNDFRWSQAIIPWHDLLLLLEGQLVHLPAPKTHYAKDICFSKDTPIFATGKNPIMFVKNGSIDERETEMMAVRWKIFRFNWQIEETKQREIPSCSKCFANLILD